MAFVAVLAIVIVVSLIGMILLKKKPESCKGRSRQRKYVSPASYRGRIEYLFWVKEGQNVRQGDTLGRHQ